MSALRLALALALIAAALPATAAEVPARLEIRAARVELAHESEPRRITLDARIARAAPGPKPGLAVEARAKLATCGLAADALFAHGFDG